MEDMKGCGAACESCQWYNNCVDSKYGLDDPCSDYADIRTNYIPLDWRLQKNDHYQYLEDWWEYVYEYEE